MDTNDTTPKNTVSSAAQPTPVPDTTYQFNPITAHQLQQLVISQASLNHLYDLKYGKYEPVHKDNIHVLPWIQKVKDLTWRPRSAVLREMAELDESMGTLAGWFKPKEEPDYSNVYLELIDILFFCLTQDIAHNSHQLEDWIEGADRGLEMRLDPSAIEKLKELLDLEINNELANTPGVMRWVMYALDVHMEVGKRADKPIRLESKADATLLFKKFLFIYYFKTELNKFRVQNGLFNKERPYVKHVFDDMEDNEWAMEVLFDLAHKIPEVQTNCDGLKMEFTWAEFIHFDEFNPIAVQAWIINQVFEHMQKVYDEEIYGDKFQ